MVVRPVRDDAEAMNAPTDAPPGPGPDTPSDPGPHDPGPRVGADEVRDLSRLRRTAGPDRKVAGVAGGLARHLDIDPVVTRVLLVVLAFFGGAGLLIYAVCWLVVPTEGTEEVPVRLDDRTRSVVLLLAGLVAALGLVGDSLGGWGPPWPLVLIGLAALVVVLATQRQPRLHPLLRPPPPAPAPPPGTGAASATAYAPYAAPPAAKATTGPRVASERRRGPVLFWYALALIALGGGVLGVVDAAGADVPGSAYPALALGVCAVLLLVGAFWGRAGGLILLGLLSAVATAGATAAAEVDAGHLEARPTTAAGVLDRYDLGVGEIDLDLTRVTDPEALDGRTVDLELDLAGRIEVVVPEGLDVVVRTSVDAGEARVFGDRLGDGERSTTGDGGAGAPTLTIDARTTFGEIEVIRKDTTR